MAAVKSSTVREIRKMLFEVEIGMHTEIKDDCYGIVFYMSEIFSQSVFKIEDARKMLYDLEDQDQIVEWYFNGSVIILIQVTV